MTFSGWPNDPPFDRRKFVQILKEQIIRGDRSIRASIGWHLWKIVQEKHLPYAEVKEYFPLFWDGVYDSHVASMCMMGTEELTTIAPQDAATLFKRMIRKSLECANENPGTQLWLSGTEKIMPLFAAQPEELIGVVADLKDLWMKGAYIGEPVTIFGSFRHVDPAQRNFVRDRLQEIYREMKGAHPPLVDVDWSD